MMAWKKRIWFSDSKLMDDSFILILMAKKSVTLSFMDANVELSGLTAALAATYLRKRRGRKIWISQEFLKIFKALF